MGVRMRFFCDSVDITAGCTGEKPAERQRVACLKRGKLLETRRFCQCPGLDYHARQRASGGQDCGGVCEADSRSQHLVTPYRAMTLWSSVMRPKELTQARTLS
jgi:hypothetical protein